MKDDFIIRADGTFQVSPQWPSVSSPRMDTWFGRNMVDYHRNQHGTLLRLGDTVRVMYHGNHITEGDIGCVRAIYEFDDLTAAAKVTVWRTAADHVIGTQYLERIDDQD